MSQHQNHIFEAIEFNNIAMLYDLGGIDKVDLNFSVVKAHKDENARQQDQCQKRIKSREAQKLAEFG